MLVRTPNPVTAARLSPLRTLLLTGAFATLSVAALAQGHPGGGMGGPGGMGGGMGMGGGGRMSGGNRSIPVAPVENQGGLRLGLPGRWWDNKDIAHTIGIDPNQQKRMDDVFGANRDNLQTLQKSLQHEESQLSKLSRSRELDENQIFQQIDRVTLARGELEKATAHYMLQIRKEMTSEQVSKMDNLQSAPPVQ
jgi:Spy/CpxP family protein refolding chaperone